jgi:cytochrome c
MKTPLQPLAALLPCLLAAAAAAAGTSTPADEGDAMKRLAAERGCSVCHRQEPVPSGSNAVVALAPSWREIAARYRGRADAEEQLTRRVIGGSDPGVRHWKNSAAFTNMLPNKVEATLDEARALVRWILALR